MWAKLFGKRKEPAEPQPISDEEVQEWVYEALLNNFKEAGIEVCREGDRIRLVQGSPAIWIDRLDHHWQPAPQSPTGRYWIVQIHFCFALNPENTGSYIVERGVGTHHQLEPAVAEAVMVWFKVVSPAVMGLLQARIPPEVERFEPGDPQGIPGRFVLAGPLVIRYKDAQDYERFMTFIKEDPLISLLRPFFQAGNSWPALTHVRIFYGGYQRNQRDADCWINGKLHPEASQALQDLPWPAVSEFVFLNYFVLIMKIPE